MIGTSHLLIDLEQLKDGTYSVKVGKKAAGRLLDGHKWNEFPNVG